MNAKIMRWSKTHTIFAGVAVIALIIGVGISRSVMHTVAQTAPLCPTGIMMGPGNSVLPGTPTTGTIVLNAATPASSGITDVTGMSFYASPALFLGNAVPLNTGTNGSYWEMKLETSVLPNGPLTLYAELKTPSLRCRTPIKYFQFNNPSITALNVSLTPVTYTAPTYSSVDYTAKLLGVSGDITKYAQIDWATGVGQAVPTGIGTMRLSTGPSGLSSNVTATLRYAGKTVQKSAPIKVVSSASSSGTTTTQATSQPSSAQTVTVGTNPTTSSAAGTTQTQAATQPTAALQDCAATAVGAERASQIKAGIVRPTPIELEKLRNCFASTNNVVPVAYAPIAPTAVKALSTESSSKITDLSNVKVKEKDVLKISGKAKASAPVYIYVFSEPLVLTTTADANGDWSYSLEDPLEPGNHEVYAVVDTGDGQYKKTDPFSFAIGTATASSENPSGLSNQLINDPTPAQSNRSIYLYVAVFAGILLLGIVIILLLYRRWSKHNQYPPSSFNQPPTSYGPPTPPSNPVYPA